MPTTPFIGVRISWLSQVAASEIRRLSDHDLGDHLAAPLLIEPINLQTPPRHASMEARGWDSLSASSLPN
jgi:hypothetical protein